MERIEKINAILAERGMSGAELCRLISASTGVYSQWNTGKSKPSNRTLKKIAEVLNVDISDLLADGENVQKNPVPQTGNGIDEDLTEMISAWSSASPEIRALALHILRYSEQSHGFLETNSSTE